MAAMTTFHAVKCCCLVNTHTTSDSLVTYAAAPVSSWSIVHPYLLDHELISYHYSACSCSCWGDLIKKRKALSFQFKSDRDHEIWQECFSCKYASTEAVGFFYLTP